MVEESVYLLEPWVRQALTAVSENEQTIVLILPETSNPQQAAGLSIKQLNGNRLNDAR